MSSSEKKPVRPDSNGILRWIILAVVICGGLWLAVKALRETPVAGSTEGAPSAGEGTPAGMPPAKVIVSPVLLQPSQETRRITGSLRAVSRAEVAAREAGAVAEVLVDEGQAVKQNDLLAILDTRRLDAELAEAKARVTAAESVGKQREAEAKRAITDFERKQKLFETGAVSEREYLDAERSKAVAIAASATAVNEIAAVASAVDLMSVRRDDLNIRAPFAGRVARRHVDAGEWLTAGSPVVTLTSSGDIEAWLNVPERYIANVTEVADDLFLVSESTGLEVKVKNLRPVADIDPATRLFAVVATVDDLGGKLAPGMSIQAELPVGKKAPRLAVPVDAMIIERDQAYVFRPAAQAGEPAAGQMPSAEKIAVSELYRRSGMVFLESDLLQKGDLVVTEGNERLMPGKPLIVLPPADDVGAAEIPTASPSQ